MKTPLIAALVALSLTATAVDANANCVTGAVVGGVVGHFAGHNALLGAGAGCVIGHEMSKKHHHRYRHYRR